MSATTAPHPGRFGSSRSTWRLSALDASFLWMEHDGLPLHVGTLLVLAGPHPPPQQFAQVVAAGLARVPWHRYRVCRMPLDLGRPIWAETSPADPVVLARGHCHHVELPAGQTLAGLVAETMANRLDATQPLWQLWQVTGLPDGQWAVVATAHHAMVDGVTGADLITALLSPAPQAAGAATPPVRGASPPDRPGPAPSRVQIAAAGGSWALRLPAQGVAAAMRAGKQPRASLGRFQQLRFGARQFIHADLPPSILNGPLGSTREYLWAEVGITAARASAEPLGATLNDWFLAVIAGTLRSYLTACGEPLGVVRALVPVAGRTSGPPTRPGNLTSAMFAVLPLGEPDPALRLAGIARDTAAAKRAGVPQATAAVARAADHIPAALLSRVASKYARARQGRVNVAASNVVGPAQRCWLGTSEVLSMVPLLPVALDVRAVFSMLSYAGQLTVGVTADQSGLPHLDALRVALNESIAQLSTVPG